MSTSHPGSIRAVAALRRFRQEDRKMILGFAKSEAIKEDCRAKLHALLGAEGDRLCRQAEEENRRKL